MSKMQRTKGQVGEREVCTILRQELGIEVNRNWQAQSAVGGADIMLPGWAIEVKRAKVLRVASWWTQAALQANACGLRPLLVYRPDRGSWMARMSMCDLRQDLKCHHQVEMALECWVNFYKHTTEGRHIHADT
jgi:(2Fe-2S) ferredoxin